MKNLIALIIISSLLFSCSSGNDKDAIKGKITEYQNQITDLSKKIKELESQLPGGSVTNSTLGKATKVRTTKVSIQPFSKYFTATGELEAINEAFVSPEVSGQITKINVVEGQKVSRGQLLAKLNTSLIEKNIKEVETQLDLAKIIYDKQTELWNDGIGSERQYLEAKNSFENLQNKMATLQEQYNMSIIRSPINGYVEDILLKQGELASPGMLLMQIVNLDRLYVVTKLSEAYLPVIKKGDVVEITFPTFPDLNLQEKVARIGNVVNKQNRTFRMEVIIDNKDGRLKPNLLANIKINDYNTNDAIIVPSYLIREDLTGSYLFLAEKNLDNWVAKKKYIKVGRSYQDKSEVLSGLSANNLIITDGYSSISDGAAISISE